MDDDLAHPSSLKRKAQSNECEPKDSSNSSLQDPESQAPAISTLEEELARALEIYPIKAVKLKTDPKAAKGHTPCSCENQAPTCSCDYDTCACDNGGAPKCSCDSNTCSCDNHTCSCDSDTYSCSCEQEHRFWQ